MQIVIRVDSSYAIGSGHLMRCLTLADELKRNGKSVAFICRKLPGHQIELITQKGFAAFCLPYESVSSIEDSQTKYEQWLGSTWQKDCRQTVRMIKANKLTPSWIIVDHYGLDRRWENSIRSITGHIMVIDDLADRFHDCDLLLDQNLYTDYKSRYKNLVDSHCILLLGPDYALLRPEFGKMHTITKGKNSKLFRILVFFGGSDISNETTKTLDAIEAISELHPYVDIVVGPSHAHRKEIQKRCFLMKNVHYHSPAKNMAQLIANSDLAVSGGGSTTWERCCLGLPSITISVAEHQAAITEGVEKAGAAIHIGIADTVSAKLISSSIRKLASNFEALIKMRTAGMTLVDGFGVSRVVESLSKIDRETMT